MVDINDDDHLPSAEPRYSSAQPKSFIGGSSNPSATAGSTCLSSAGWNWDRVAAARLCKANIRDAELSGESGHGRGPNFFVENGSFHQCPPAPIV